VLVGFVGRTPTPHPPATQDLYEVETGRIVLLVAHVPSHGEDAAEAASPDQTLWRGGAKGVNSATQRGKGARASAEVAGPGRESRYATIYQSRPGADAGSGPDSCPSWGTKYSQTFSLASPSSRHSRTETAYHSRPIGNRHLHKFRCPAASTRPLIVFTPRTTYIPGPVSDKR